jgi:reactive intermediate/imine deaminase
LNGGELVTVNRRKFLKRTGATALGAAAIAQPAAASGRGRQTAAPRPKARTARRKITTDQAPRPAGPYSQAIVAGNTVYVAGQVGNDPRTGRVAEGGFEAQAAQVFENIIAILKAAGATPADVVRVNAYLTDFANFPKMNEIYRRYFSEDYPVRTTVGVQLASTYLIEADCIAVI